MSRQKWYANSLIVCSQKQNLQCFVVTWGESSWDLECGNLVNYGLRVASKIQKQCYICRCCNCCSYFGWNSELHFYGRSKSKLMLPFWVSGVHEPSHELESVPCSFWRLIELLVMSQWCSYNSISDFLRRNSCPYYC